MNAKRIGYSMGATILSLLAPGLFAAGVDPWLTVDIHHPIDQPVSESANGSEIAINEITGLIYTSGGVGRDREGQWVATLRGSADGGNEWTTVDSFSLAPWTWSQFRAVATGSEQQVLTAGSLYNSNNGEKAWFVRESFDSGLTWGFSDFVYTAGGSGLSCADIEVSPSGDVYAVGSGSSSTAGTWLIRKRAAGQESFVTVDAVSGNNQPVAASIAFHPNGIFVAGNVTTTGPAGWTVRMSPTGASGTWRTVDSFKEQNCPSSAVGVAVGANGWIYVVGWAEQTTGKGKNLTQLKNWIVRRSTNGGTTWAVVDRFGGLPSGSLISANAIAVDATDGTVFVAGSMLDRGIVRKGAPGSNGAMSWVTSDDFQLFAGREGRLNAIAIDQATGDVFAHGGANDASAAYGVGMGHWVTRKLSR